MEDTSVRQVCLAATKAVAECSCYRLGRAAPLDDGEALPDHVSERMMRASCARWITQGSSRNNFCEIPLGNGMVTERVRYTTWPVPIKRTNYHLVLVIRQWVEEEPDPALARLFDEEPAWLRAVERFGERDPILAERWLAANGLPATPSTARYFAAVVQRQPLEAAPGPTRGVLVNSLVLRDREGGALHDQVVLQVNCTMPWATDDLRRKANKVAAEHSNWWGELPGSNMRDMSLRRLNRRPKDELTADVDEYLDGKLTRQELNDRACARAEALHPDRWTPLKRPSVLRQVERRVYEAEKRRREQGEERS